MYLSIIKIALPALLALFVAGGLWKQGVKLESVRAELKQAQAELATAQAANESSVEAIKRMKDELRKSNNACSARLKSKENLTARLREIDALKKDKTMDSIDKSKIIDSGASRKLGLESWNEENSNVHSDSILRELNRMFIR